MSILSCWNANSFGVKALSLTSMTRVTQLCRFIICKCWINNSSRLCDTEYPCPLRRRLLTNFKSFWAAGDTLIIIYIQVVIVAWRQLPEIISYNFGITVIIIKWYSAPAISACSACFTDFQKSSPRGLLSSALMLGVPRLWNMDGPFRLVLIKLAVPVSYRWRCSPSAPRKVYDRLFTSGTTVSKLRNATISGRLFPGLTDSINIVGRSLAWKVRRKLWIHRLLTFIPTSSFWRRRNHYRLHYQPGRVRFWNL